MKMPNICDALRNLVPFLQFKKPEKHPWRNVTFSKLAGCTPQRFLNCINGTNSAKHLK